MYENIELFCIVKRDLQGAHVSIFRFTDKTSSKIVVKLCKL